MGLLSYRRGLPMTMRTCFYPLWGKQIEGWRGDVVDVLSIMCTLFGVCTSLGLGVRQLNRGLIRLDRGTYMGVDYYGSEYTSSGELRAAQNTAWKIAEISAMWCAPGVVPTRGGSASERFRASPKA